jgi:hypothetical protein
MEVANKVFEEMSLWISARYHSLLPFSKSILGRQLITVQSNSCNFKLW